jgi:DNA-binding MarR family transcriptional regulator
MDNSHAKYVLNELLVVIFNQILSIEDEALRKQGVTLSMSEVHVLEAIMKTDEPIMGSVAKRLRITMGTLTTSINTLVKKGYVLRVKDILDKRKVLLKLTNKSIPVMKLHDAFHEDMISTVIKDLHIDQNEALIQSLESLSTYFREKF